MSRRLRHMTAADLAALPEPCIACTFWETSVANLAAPADHAEEIFLSAFSNGPAELRRGATIVDGGRPDGHLRGRWSEGAEQGRPKGQELAAIAVLLAVHVAEEWRGRGLGRQLVQTAAGLLTRRDIRAVEAVGTYHDSPSCMAPVGWLEAVGFSMVRPHPVTPLLRMDLQNTVRWRPDLGAAWHRLTGLVAPTAPEPAAYARREPTEPLVGPPTALGGHS